jgi:DNA polymerase-3 subunit alpha
VTLEDLKGYLEMVVFADLYRTTQGLLKADEPIVVRGQVDFNEDTVKLLANQILSLRSLEEPVQKTIHIRVAPENLNENKLKDFRLILSRYPGHSPVYLHLISLNTPNGSEKVLKLPRELETEWGLELEYELQNLLGHGVQITVSSMVGFS